MRPRLLVVEDSFPVAEGLKALLEGLGFAIVGMAGTIEKAVELVRARDFELAILDIDLHGKTATAVASAVQQRGKSLIYLSGYGDANMLPSHLRDYPRLEKPVHPDTLAALLRELFRGDPVPAASDGGIAGESMIARSAKGVRVRDTGSG